MWSVIVCQIQKSLYDVWLVAQVLSYEGFDDMCCKYPKTLADLLVLMGPHTHGSSHGQERSSTLKDV